jgi:hypothetical protein
MVSQMSKNKTGLVVLDRCPKINFRNPSVDDVLSLMKVISAGPERGGAPEATLNYFEAESSEEKPQIRLHLLLAIPKSGSNEWLILFSEPSSQAFTLLATGLPTSDRFETRTCVGTVMQYRRECLLKMTDPCLRKAIECYLTHLSRSPELTWIDYFDCVRD